MQESKTNTDPNTAQECKIDVTPNKELNSNFDELRKGMKKDIYWVRFFCRPCCPAPGVSGANKMLDRLRDEALESNEYTQVQKEELISIIEERRAWYPHSGLCRK